MGNIVRQCAWCLCLINGAGKRITPTPLPKMYEASHGICDVCGTVWMEQVTTQEVGDVVHPDEENASENGNYTAYPLLTRENPLVTELVFDLQQKKKVQSKNLRAIRKNSFL